MCNRLILYIEKLKLLYPKQFGFHAGNYTQDAVAHLVESIIKKLDNYDNAFVYLLTLPRHLIPSTIQYCFLNYIDMVFVALYITGFQVI